MSSQQQLVDDILKKDILEILGAQNMSDEEKEKLYLKMADAVQERVIIRIHDRLNDQEVEEWKKVLETDDKNQIQSFLNSHNIDFIKMLLEEAVIYKTEIATLIHGNKQEE